MFIPSAEALDTSYFMSRYIWNPEDEHLAGGSDFDDITESSTGSGSDFLDEDVRKLSNFSIHALQTTLSLLAVVLLTSKNLII